MKTNSGENLWVGVGQLDCGATRFQVQGWDQLLWWNIDPEVPGPYSTIGGMVGIDGFVLFVTIVICAAVALATLLTDAYLRREDMEGPEDERA